MPSVPASAPQRPPTEPVPELADHLGYLIKHAQLRLAELTTTALAPLGINGRELAVLRVIEGQPPSSQLQIANRMGVDRTSMVALIDTLQSKQLVERSPDPVDRRRNVTILTERGRVTIRDAIIAVETAERSFLSPLSPEDARGVGRTLRTLAFPG
jgi:DNA-binding MarR family transcriptional regulator